MNSKWKYLRRLLKNKKDISIEINSSVPYITLPRPRYIFDVASPMSNARGTKPGNKDERSIGRRELYDYFIKRTNIPIIENTNVPEYDVVKEGKTNKGKQSQLDIPRTLLEKMKRLVVSDKELSADSLFGDPFHDTDLVYNRFAIKENYKRTAVVILCVDVSGSVSDIERIIGKSLIIGLLQFFGTNFDTVKFYCITHEVEAHFFGPVTVNKSEDPLSFLDTEAGKPLLDFSQFNGGGGTALEETIEILLDIKTKEPKTPTYLFYSGDLEVGTEDMANFNKQILAENMFNFYGFLVYGDAPVAKTLGHIPVDHTILIMGREVRRQNDPADVIKWVFDNLGKHGTFTYDKTR